MRKFRQYLFKLNAVDMTVFGGLNTRRHEQRRRLRRFEEVVVRKVCACEYRSKDVARAVEGAL